MVEYEELKDIFVRANEIQHLFYDKCYNPIFKQNLGNKVAFDDVFDALYHVKNASQYIFEEIEIYKSSLQRAPDCLLALDSLKDYLNQLLACQQELHDITLRLRKKAEGVFRAYPFRRYLKDTKSLDFAIRVLEFKGNVLQDDYEKMMHALSSSSSSSSSSSGESLWDVDSFAWLYLFIKEFFPYYVSKAKPKNSEMILSFMNYVLQALDSFAEGNGVEEFSFSFAHREQDELWYLSVSDDGESAVTITEGGSVYTPDVGSDSFTNWMWTIWDNGEEDGNLLLDMKTVAEMINLGARLIIEVPDEYCYDSDKQEDDED